MNLSIGNKLIWIKGENEGTDEIISAELNGQVVFQSGRSIFITLVEEFLMDYEEYLNDEVLNPNYNSNTVRQMWEPSKEVKETKIDFSQPINLGHSGTFNFDSNMNPQPENKSVPESEFSMLFKGKNLINRKLKMDVDLKVPTDFIIKGLLSAYGLNDIEPSIIYMVKDQLIKELDNLSKNIASKIISKLKNKKEDKNEE